MTDAEKAFKEGRNYETPYTPYGKCNYSFTPEEVGIITASLKSQDKPVEVTVENAMEQLIDFGVARFDAKDAVHWLKSKQNGVKIIKGVE